MKVLVDTGATNSIIHQSSLSKIRHDRIYPVQQQFFLANKTCIFITGYVTLEIKIQHIKIYVTAAITRTLCYDVILGEDWINRSQVTINRFRNKIEILGNKATVPLRTSSNKSFMPITLKFATSIPPHTEPIVEACTSIRQATKALFSPDVLSLII
jgi:predicted aspartyl protease